MVIVKASELIVSCLEEIPMLWHPFFPRTGLIGIVGASEAGKSLFARQLAISVVEGKNEFLGNRFNPVRKIALIISTEDGQDSIGWLLRKQAIKVPMTSLDNLHICFQSENLFSDLDHQMNKLYPDVVVIDVWSDTFGGNPNNWSEVRRHLGKISNLAEKYQCLVVIIHHTVKYAERSLSDKNKVNGSQGIEAKLRGVFELKNGKEPNQREFRVLKANHLSPEQKAEGYLLKLDPETYLFHNTGEKLSISGSIVKGGRTYDTNLWIQRMHEIDREGMSLKKAYLELCERYNEGVPSYPWFRDNYKR